jgi:hypothetical protein
LQVAFAKQADACLESFVGVAGWFGDQAVKGEIAMNEVSEPSLGQPGDEWRHIVRLDGEPLVWGLTINAPADSQHLSREDFLFRDATHMLDDRIRERQIKMMIGKWNRQSAALHVVRFTVERIVWLLLQIENGDAIGEGEPLPGWRGPTQIDYEFTGMEFLLYPTRAPRPKELQGRCVNLMDVHCGKPFVTPEQNPALVLERVGQVREGSRPVSVCGSSWPVRWLILR